MGKLLGDGFVFNQIIQYCMAQRFCKQDCWYRRQNPERPRFNKYPVRYQGMDNSSSILQGTLHQSASTRHRYRRVYVLVAAGVYCTASRVVSLGLSFRYLSVARELFAVATSTGTTPWLGQESHLPPRELAPVFRRKVPDAVCESAPVLLSVEPEGGDSGSVVPC